MRILGELLVLFALAALGMGFAMRRYVAPALRRRRIAELERENDELDAKLARFRGDHDNAGGTLR